MFDLIPRQLGVVHPDTPGRLAEPELEALGVEAPHVGLFRSHARTYLLEFWTQAEWSAIPPGQRPVENAWFMGGPNLFGMFRVRALDADEEQAGYKAMDRIMARPRS
jgi:hypothetical protein